MSTAEGWYDDPAHPGRLRYWDGGDWTEWVNENGETRSEALPPPPGEVAAVTAAPTGSPTETGAPIPTGEGYQPSPEVQAAPAWGASDPAPASTAQEANPLQRMGMIGVGVAGLISLASFGQQLTRSVGQVVESGYDVGNAPIIIVPLLLIAAVLVLFVKNAAARVVAVVLASAGLLFTVLMLLGVRGGEQFIQNSEIAIKSGWWILLAVAVVGIAGLAMAMGGTLPRSKGSRAAVLIVYALVLLLMLGILIMALITDPSSSWVQPK